MNILTVYESSLERLMSDSPGMMSIKSEGFSLSVCPNVNTSVGYPRTEMLCLVIGDVILVEVERNLKRNENILLILNIRLLMKLLIHETSIFFTSRHRSIYIY